MQPIDIHPTYGFESQFGDNARNCGNTDLRRP
ncbi:hypothetical protein K2D_19870 [Planctomycetes bacterium K2D]|nr:hypothetical protein K2D_19870 [Planctomycetes bacterium K2D]